MAEKPTKKGIDFHDQGQTAQELQAIKAVIASFIMAAKNYAMYPESHATCQNSLQAVKFCIDAFIENYGDLRFDVEKDRLLFQSEMVQQDDPKTVKLAFPLFRDGIQWLEFKQGLELWEISGFLKIHNQYGILQKEAKGDLVTALWEMDFPHLQYAAMDVLWKAETVTDFSTFRVTDDEKQATAGHEIEHERLHDTVMQEQVDDEQGLANTERDPNAGVDMLLSTMDTTIWQLTQEESQKLKEMVAEEESQSGTQDVLDVLEVILQAQNEPEDYSIILEFIKKEFKNTLAQGEFQMALDFIENLQKSYQSCKIEKPWAQPLLGQFFINISDPKVLGVLKQVLPTINKQHAENVKVFRRLLLRFPPVAITALGPLLLQKLSVSVERQLMEVIGLLALKDIYPLIQLLDRPEEVLVKKLVFILAHIKGEKTEQILLEMTHHESDRVRLEALKALTRRDINMIKKLFHLIDDPVLTIRRLMWNYLEKHKNRETGNLILNYLDHKKIRRDDYQQILNCYKTLVRCDSRYFVSFLRESLLGQGWGFSFDSSLRRRGAALALLELNTEQAKEILDQASKSLFPSIRSAYRKALKVHK
ncbi:MAG: HEAT repeat domain-containing protein [Thermodesulfobacteriota bacterium]|nr:HEAT repeat domain-containing protein [Thermodesulfobacteriota bacterium]